MREKTRTGLRLREDWDTDPDLAVVAHLVGGLQRYVEEGVRPGGFLCAVLANDLTGAAARVDCEHRAHLTTIARFVWDYVPDELRGGTQEVDSWVSLWSEEVSA